MSIEKSLFYDLHYFYIFNMNERKIYRRNHLPQFHFISGMCGLEIERRKDMDYTTYQYNDLEEGVAIKMWEIKDFYRD